MSEGELEKLVETKIEEFHGFLNREVALKLIAKEKGLMKNEERIVTIKDIQKGDKNISLIAKIEKIFQTAEYPNGKKSRKIVLTDGSKIAIRLWNKDVDLAKRVKTGDEVVVNRAYEKNGELALSYSGEFVLSKSAPFAKINELEDGAIVNIKGTIINADKKQANVFNDFHFFISDGENAVECVANGNRNLGLHIIPEDEIVIENAVFRGNVIKVVEESRVLVKRMKGVTAGKLSEINSEDGGVVLTVDDKKVKLNREQFLKLLSLKIPPDISIETVVSLKKDSVLNKYIRIPNMPDLK